jgi:drug/metabolite transporter (DMT)-like permease
MAKNTGNVTIIGFSSVIVGYGISFFRYGEAPNIFGILGSIGILVGLILILYKSTANVK